MSGSSPKASPARGASGRSLFGNAIVATGAVPRTRATVFTREESSAPDKPSAPLLAFALARPGVGGAIALEERDRATGLGGCWFAGQIQRCQPGVDADAGSPTRQSDPSLAALLLYSPAVRSGV
jgi:hypothetical protein